MLQTKDTKFLLVLEAAKRSLIAAEILFARIVKELKSFEQSIEQSTELGQAAAIPLIDSASFVDFAHRFGTLVDSIPLIKKNAPQIKQLRNTLKVVVEARNHLQHLRGDLSANKDIDFPILGYLQWSDNKMNYIIAFTQSASFDIIGMSYDINNKEWEDGFEYHVNGKKINLGKILEEMRKSYDFITSQVECSDPSILKLAWGKTQTLGIKFIEKNTDT